MNSIRSAGHWISAKTKGGAATASKESNKQIAKDPHVRTSTRLRAAGNAMSDKIEATGHNRRAELHKNKVKHNY